MYMVSVRSLSVDDVNYDLIISYVYFNSSIINPQRIRKGYGSLCVCVCVCVYVCVCLSVTTLAASYLIYTLKTR